MDKLITDIIQKVKREYRKDTRIANILSASVPHIELSYHNDKLVLESITFDYYDRVVLTKSEMYFSPEHGHSETLLSYKKWENLLIFLDS